MNIWLLIQISKFKNKFDILMKKEEIKTSTSVNKEKLLR
jgi:hypothetical protein